MTTTRASHRPVARLAGAALLGGALALTAPFGASAAPLDTANVTAPAGITVDLQVCPMFSPCDDPQSLVNDEFTENSSLVTQSFIVITNSGTSPITIDPTTIQSGVADVTFTEFGKKTITIKPGASWQSRVDFGAQLNYGGASIIHEQDALIDAQASFVTSAGPVTADWTMERVGLWNVELSNTEVIPDAPGGTTGEVAGTLSTTVTVEPTEYMLAYVEAQRAAGTATYAWSPGVVFDLQSQSIAAEWDTMDYSDFLTSETKSHPTWMQNASLTRDSFFGNKVDLLNFGNAVWPDDGVTPSYTAELAGIPVTFDPSEELTLSGKALNATSGAGWGFVNEDTVTEITP